MKSGDLVVIKARQKIGAKGFTTFPGVYDYHEAVWVESGIGIIVESRDVFHKVFIHGRNVWFEHFVVRPVQNTTQP